MQQIDVYQNPFSIQQFNCSWAAIKEQVTEILFHMPEKYKLAYEDETEQKLILFTSLDFNIFGKERMNVIYLSKIDSHQQQCMIAFEVKNYNGDITTKEDFERGRFFMDILAEDMMQLFN
ncbi:hypothetical protein I5907_11240 [Panacibacter sp. DH6]|uniref:Uncharacterized protein n=1 Tax=Panacibacter microcysteis TaxID=2793269 RepID=A0A931GXX2_9BACT|nr:hypothetical protein [Panacibacter microcysteis]MBG9376814.1 hypothetical protein [Panacibacter microcysteis]